MDVAGKRVCVTGATGFVGSHLTRKLVEQGASVKVLVREQADQSIVGRLRDELGAEICVGDVRDSDSLIEAFEGVEIVYNIAALFRQAKHPDATYWEINRDGVRNVMEAAVSSNVRRVVHCSTVGVHSHIPQPPANEDEDHRPGDIYQLTKSAGEKVARSYFDSELEVVVIRPAMIWGEGDNRLLKLFKGVKQRKFPIIGSGLTLTHWIHVEDLVKAFILASLSENAPGNTYIIAGKRPVSIAHLVEKVAERAGVKPLPIKIPAKPVQWLGSAVETICVPLGVEPPIYRRRVDFFTKDRAFDTTRAQRDLGFEPEGDFEHEVDRIYSWYEGQGWLN